MEAPAVSGTERFSCGHVMPVAVMVAPTIGETERVGGGHIMTVVMMVAPAVCGTGGCKLGM